MEQAKSSSPKLFVCTAIENKDEIEEVICSISQFLNKESFSRPCKAIISFIAGGGAADFVARNYKRFANRTVFL